MDEKSKEVIENQENIINNLEAQIEQLEEEKRQLEKNQPIQFTSSLTRQNKQIEKNLQFKI